MGGRPSGVCVRYGTSGGNVVDQPLSLRNVGFGPILIFDDDSGAALSPEHIRHQALALLEGAEVDLAHRIEAGAFAAEHRIDVPAAALDGMTPEQREWAGGSLRLGMFGKRVVAVARDECMRFHCIYDGPDMDEAVRAIRGYADLMERRGSVDEVAAMSMRNREPRHGVGGMTT